MEIAQQKFEKYKAFIIFGSLGLLLLIAGFLAFKAIVSRPLLSLEALSVLDQEIVFVKEISHGTHEELASIHLDGTGLSLGTKTVNPLPIGSSRVIIHRLLSRFVPDNIYGVYKDKPTWSPTGEKVAFISGVYYINIDVPSQKGDVYVMDADGGNLRRLTDEFVFIGEPVCEDSLISWTLN